MCGILYFVFVTPVVVPRGYLEDSRSFNGDPPHLTLVPQSRFPSHLAEWTKEGCIGKFP